MSFRSPRFYGTTLLLLSASALAGCVKASAQSAPPPLQHAVPAVRTAEPPRPVSIVTIPMALPLPGQLKPMQVAGDKKDEDADPRSRIGAANAAARMQPTGRDFLNAIQLYPWSEGALYQVYAAPGQVTDIALQPGEKLVGPGPVAAGDTVRWIIGDTLSGSGEAQRVHILVKPTRPDLATNMVINTDRRTYHLEIRATPGTYMASVSWTYPHDQLIALRSRIAAEEQAAPVAAGVDLASLNFSYRIEGDTPSWRPLRVFDDGRQVFIEFPPSVAELPPLFVVGASGSGELVNYRVRDRFMIVDRLFEAAELRLGDRKRQQVVRILRSDARARRKGR